MSRSKFTVLEKLVEEGIEYFTTTVQHKETASLQMNTGMKPLRNRFNFLLFHLSI